MNLPLASSITVAVAVGALVLAIVLAWWRRRALGWVAVGVLSLVVGSIAVNDYFAYFPTVADVAGRHAKDQASPAKVATVDARPTLPARGLVEQVAIPGTTSGFAGRPAEVYLPPAWFASPRPALPVIELLHGSPGMPEDWTRGAQVDVVSDQWATDHGGFAPIIVMPDVNGSFTGNTQCLNGRRGNAETYLVDDVHRFMAERYGARTDRMGWTVGGLSEGGYCAMNLTAAHPDQFATFLNFGGSGRPTHWQRREPHHPITTVPAGSGVAGWFEVGAADGATTREVQAAEAGMRLAGLETHLTLLPGGHHTFRVWRQSFVDSLPWAISRMQPPAA
jgi:enterochelin esterase-like enzyme